MIAPKPVSVPMTKRINNVQALRGLAALLVVYLHCGLFFWKFGPFGGFGVEVFFMISGFVMGYTALNNSSQFLTRRLIRVIPAYWAATLAVFAAANWHPHLMMVTRADPGALVKSLLFVPYTRGDGQIQPMLFLGWTLNYEMYFYVLMAIALAICKSRPGLLTTLLITAGIVVCRPFAGSSPVAYFYSRLLVFDFVAGIAV